MQMDPNNENTRRLTINSSKRFRAIRTRTFRVIRRAKKRLRTSAANPRRWAATAASNGAAKWQSATWRLTAAAIADNEQLQTYRPVRNRDRSSIVCLVLGAYVDVLEYSALFMASLCSMLPLAKKSVKAAVLSYLATAILAAFIVIKSPAMLILYGVFFGLHPTVNYIFREKKFNKILGCLIKAVWFVGSLVLIYFTFGEFFTEGTIFEREEFKNTRCLL